MPIYVYRCPECGGEEEFERGMDEEISPVCEECRAPMSQKFIPTGIRVEGGASPNRTSVE